MIDDGDDARLSCALRVPLPSRICVVLVILTTGQTLVSFFHAKCRHKIDPLILLTMASANQSVWIVRYGLTKYSLQENLGPYDSK